MRKFFIDTPRFDGVAYGLFVSAWCMMLIGANCTPMTPDGGGNGNVVDNTNENENDNGEPAPRCGPGAAAEATTVSYNADLIPLLADHDCLSSACHGGQFFSSGYDLRTHAGIFGPGDQAEQFGLCNVVPGDPEASYLIEKLRGNPRSGLPMPQVGERLTEEEIQMIMTWIEEGAQDN